jgi:hypothetical protein
MQINYFIGGIEVEPPLNQAEFGIELNFDKDDNSNQAVSLTEFEFGLGSQVDSKDAASLINLHRSNGLSTGVGIFEGLPFKIELTEGNTTEVLFDGYLNTSTALWDCDRVIVQATEKGNIDFLNETADSVTFAYLYEKTNLKNDFRFISVPYVLSSVPDNKEAAISLITITFTVITISNQIEDLIEMVTDALNPFITVTTAIKIVLRVIYITGLIIQLINLIQRAINLLIQPTKYHEVMTVKNLCEIGASHFGLTFESSIFNRQDYADKIVILPKKYSQDVNESLLGGLVENVLGNVLPNNTASRGYYQGTFGQLLRDLKEVINGKIIIDGNVLRLEREDYNNSSYNYQVPPVDQTQYTLNHEELKSNYSVEFQTDINDKNTLINYDGTITQVITRPDRIVNNDMVLMSGLDQRFIPFARAARKTELTNVEGIIQSLVDSFNNAIGSFTDEADAAFSAIGQSSTTFPFPDLSNLIGDRIGMLLLENDIIDVPKLMLIDESSNPINTKINSNNDNIINSEFLYNNFHFLRNFAITEERPHGNQYKIYSATGVPFCWATIYKMIQVEKGN